MTRSINPLQIAISLGVVWWFMRNDVADYAAFKLLTRSADRQRKFLIWTLKGFLMFAGLAFLNLLMLGRVHTISALPPEFAGLSSLIDSRFSHSPSLRTGFVTGIGCGVLAGIIAGVLLAKKNKKKQTASPYIGNIEPLLPRNGAESACAALMSINAGFSEELFFRLTFPLLLVSLFGNAVLCFVLAAVFFGVCHWYQGPAGVAGTSVLALLLTAVYLGTGSLWIAMITHAGLDLFNLVLRPWLQRAASSAVFSRT